MQGAFPCATAAQTEAEQHINLQESPGAEDVGSAFQVSISIAQGCIAIEVGSGIWRYFENYNIVLLALDHGR